MKRYFIPSFVLVLMFIACKSAVTPEEKGWYITNYTADDISITVNTDSVSIPAGKNYFFSNMENPEDVKNLDTEKYKYISSYFYPVNKKIYREFRIVPKNY